MKSQPKKVVQKVSPPEKPVTATPQPSQERTTSGAHRTYWLDSVEPLSLPKLHENISADVVIVGGGITGLTIAFNLSRDGYRVALVDDGNVGSGETGRTSAHLSTVLDHRYFELEKKYGARNTKLIAESHRRAIDFIELLQQNEQISCDFKRIPGYLFRHPTDDLDVLQKELEAATRAGLSVQRLDQVPGMQHEKGDCLLFEQQARFHPLKYLYGLCQAAIEKGARIFADTHAATIDTKGIVTSDGYSITARHIVVATNTPVNNKIAMHLRQAAVRTYIIGARVRKGSVEDALWWDTGDQTKDGLTQPYHYIRLQPYDAEYDLLICGGEDHPTGSGKKTANETRYDTLEKWLRRKFSIEDVVYRWSGQVMEPMDALACIGHNPGNEDNVYIITSASGSGLTYGVIAGMIIPDLIKGKRNRWEKLYDPARFKLRRAVLYVKQTIRAVLGSLKAKKQFPPLGEVKRGEGKLVEIDGNKLGAYRDNQNVVHLVSTACTHLQCTVHWNSDEKSWDCPCHGSRFSYKGKVMNGPANKNLEYHSINSEGRKAVE